MYLNGLLDRQRCWEAEDLESHMLECRHSGKTNQHKFSQRDTYTFCSPKLRTFFVVIRQHLCMYALRAGFKHSEC